MQSQKTSEASDDEEEGFLMRDEDLHHAMDSDEEPALTLNNRRPGGGGHAPDRFPSATPSPLPPEQGAWGGGVGEIVLITRQEYLIPIKNEG